jgi:hypothetical protein
VSTKYLFKFGKQEVVLRLSVKMMVYLYMVNTEEVG